VDFNLFGVHSVWKTYHSTSGELTYEQTSTSERSGHRIEKGERQSIPGERHWRTREDPLDAIWEKELVPPLEKDARLTGLTLWEYQEEELAGQFPYRELRTLQRRFKHWKAPYTRSGLSLHIEANDISDKRKKL